MSETATKETEPVEITVAAEPEKIEPTPAPSRDDLRKQGWSKHELDAAEKRGMIAKPEEKAKEPEKPAPVKDPSKTASEAAKPEDKKVEEPAPEAKPKPIGSLPDFTMNPEQEKVFLATFGAGTAPRAMYYRMKNERQARQAAEKRAQELDARIKALESVPKVASQPVDENGQPIDLENQPLTLKALKDMRRQEDEEAARQRQEQDARAQTVAQAHRDQEEYARAMYPDFDAVIGRAKEVMTNLETLVPEKWKQMKAVQLIRNLQISAAQADKMGLDEYTAAMLAYEIGQLHPDHGQAPKPAETKKTGPSTEDPKAHGGHTPEQMRRIEENTQRRPSSASVPDGGGKRTIAAEDVDLATLNKMSFAERVKFRENHPSRYAKLLRG